MIKNIPTSSLAAGQNVEDHPALLMLDVPGADRKDEQSASEKERKKVGSFLTRVLFYKVMRYSILELGIQRKINCTRSLLLNISVYGRENLHVRIYNVLLEVKHNGERCLCFRRTASS